MDETTKQSSDVAIALIQKDIEYIKESTRKIDETLKVFDRNFARKDELKEIEKILEKNYAEIKLEIARKVDHTDFDPIKKILYRINWLLISAVVFGILALIWKIKIN
jgi:type VI protein secretion system component VasA